MQTRSQTQHQSTNSYSRTFSQPETTFSTMSRHASLGSIIYKLAEQHNFTINSPYLDKNDGVVYFTNSDGTYSRVDIYTCDQYNELVDWNKYMPNKHIQEDSYDTEWHNTKVFSNMTVIPHEGGYLLYAPMDYIPSPCYGEWDQVKNAWFYTTEYYNYLINEGAQLYVPAQEINSSNTLQEETPIQTLDIFSGMTVEPRGRGYLLVPNENHPDIGQKYYHNGWWIPIHDAWFFKSQYYDFLIDNGAVDSTVSNTTQEYGSTEANVTTGTSSTEANVTTGTSSTEANVTTGTSSTGMFSGMTVEPHGRGYLLVPSENHPDIGQKYYHNGWWIPIHDAWFFKSQYYDFLIDNGAVDGSTEETPQTEGIFSGMTVESHGRGHLLIPDDEHPDYGKKYYHNGWWMSKHSAWFFKSQFYTYLIQNGATA